MSVTEVPLFNFLKPIDFLTSEKQTDNVRGILPNMEGHLLLSLYKYIAGGQHIFREPSLITTSYTFGSLPYLFLYFSFASAMNLSYISSFTRLMVQPPKPPP